MSMETAGRSGKLPAGSDLAIIDRYNTCPGACARLTTGDGAPNLLKKIGVE
jgi:hypothetical protein